MLEAQDRKLYQLDQKRYALYSVAATPSVLTIVLGVYLYVMVYGRHVH